MLADQTFAFGPKITDREGWSRLAATEAYGKVIRDAERALKNPVPEMTEELYLLYKKTGLRTAEYGRVRSTRYGLIEVDPKKWTGGIVTNRTQKKVRSTCPRNDVSTVPS